MDGQLPLEICSVSLYLLHSSIALYNLSLLILCRVQLDSLVLLAIRIDHDSEVILRQLIAPGIELRSLQ